MNAQRKIAAKILKCGMRRVWLDPKRLDDISNAITRRDVSALISGRIIKKIPDAGISSGRNRLLKIQKKKGSRKGRGSRKGSRHMKKKNWIRKIRSLRRYMKLLREKGMITNDVFKKIYKISMSGYFKDKGHLKIYLERSGMLKKRVEKNVREAEKKE